MKRCSTCGVEKDATEFSRNATRKDGLQSYCKACAAEYQKRYRAENPDKVRERQKRWYAENHDKVRESHKRWRAENPDKKRGSDKQWQANNPDKVKAKTHRRRARIMSAGGSFTAADIAAIRVAQADRCWYCGKRLHGKGHIDHFIPLAKGGTNDPGNLRLACASCNLRKGAALPTELGRLL